MRLNKDQQRYVLATLEEMRLEIEEAGVRSKIEQDKLKEIDERITKLQKLLKDEQQLVRKFSEY